MERSEAEEQLFDEDMGFVWIFAEETEKEDEETARRGVELRAEVLRNASVFPPMGETAGGTLDETVVELIRGARLDESFISQHKQLFYGGSLLGDHTAGLNSLRYRNSFSIKNPWGLVHEATSTAEVLPETDEQAEKVERADTDEQEETVERAETAGSEPPADWSGQLERTSAPLHHGFSFSPEKDIIEDPSAALQTPQQINAEDDWNDDVPSLGFVFQMKTTADGGIAEHDPGIEIDELEINERTAYASGKKENEILINEKNIQVDLEDYTHEGMERLFHSLVMIRDYLLSLNEQPMDEQYPPRAASRGGSSLSGVLTSFLGLLRKIQCEYQPQKNTDDVPDSLDELIRSLETYIKEAFPQKLESWRGGTSLKDNPELEEAVKKRISEVEDELHSAYRSLEESEYEKSRLLNRLSSLKLRHLEDFELEALNRINQADVPDPTDIDILDRLVNRIKLSHNASLTFPSFTYFNI